MSVSPSSLVPDAADPHRPDRLGAMARAVRWPVAGLLVGLTWGAIARAWMRYISTDPAFTWSGTLMILGLAGLAGASLAGAEGLRRSGAGGARRLLAVPALVMFLGAGLVMLPSAVLGGLAISGRGGRWVRYPAALLAVAPIGIVLRGDGEGLPHSTVITVVWYVALCLALAAAWTAVILPSAGSRRSNR